MDSSKPLKTSSITTGDLLFIAMPNNTPPDVKPVNVTKPCQISAKIPFHPFEPPTRPWDTITIDLVSPLHHDPAVNSPESSD